MANRQISYKLVLLGESAVGKSSIVQRFVKSQFHEYQDATIGAAYVTQSLMVGDPPVTVKLEIWDTAGQERYHSLAPMYYRGAHVAIIVYDITSQDSFTRAIKWVKELREFAPCVQVIAFTGNKSDLHHQRLVSTEEAETHAKDNGLLFMETSAKTAANVMNLFTLIAESLLRTAQLPTDSGTQRLEESAPRTDTSSCCK